MAEIMNGSHTEGDEEVFGFKVSEPHSSQEERDDEDSTACKLTNGFHHGQGEKGGGDKWSNLPPDPRVTNGGDFSPMDEDSSDGGGWTGKERGRQPFQYSTLDEASSSDTSPIVSRREPGGERGVAEMGDEGRRLELPVGEGEGGSQTESLSSVEITSDGRSSSRYSSR